MLTCPYNHHRTSQLIVASKHIKEILEDKGIINPPPLSYFIPIYKLTKVFCQPRLVKRSNPVKLIRKNLADADLEPNGCEFACHYDESNRRLVCAMQKAAAFPIVALGYGLIPECMETIVNETFVDMSEEDVNIVASSIGFAFKQALYRSYVDRCKWQAKELKLKEVFRASTGNTNGLL